MSDQDIIDRAVASHAAGHPITDGQARVIAASWHGGQWSALYSLSSTGAILESETDPHGRDAVRELESEQDTAGALAAESEGLDALLAYVLRHGPRGPVAGWSNLWG